MEELQNEPKKRGPKPSVPSIAIPPEFAERMVGLSVTENLEPVVTELSQKLAEKSHQASDIKALLKAMELVCQATIQWTHKTTQIDPPVFAVFCSAFMRQAVA